MERRIDPLSVTYCRATHDRDQHHDCRLALRAKPLPTPIAAELALVLGMPRCFLPLSMALASPAKHRWFASLTGARFASRAGSEIHDLLCRQEP